MGSTFLHLRFAFAAALSPGKSFMSDSQWPRSKSSTLAPQNDFWFAAWQGWSSSWWTVETWAQLYPYPHFTCLTVKTFELQPTFPSVVPQWSSKLELKVLLAPDILVVVGQVRDKAVAKMQRKQVLFKIIYLQWPVPFGSVCVRRK